MANGSRCCNGVPTVIDSSNCEACGQSCPANNVCFVNGDTGTCVSGCPTGFTPCNGICKDLNNDNNFCGSCTTMCPPGSFCAGGTCAPNVCANQWVFCQTAGGCIQPTTVNNCNQCGSSCRLYCVNIPTGTAGVPLTTQGLCACSSAADCAGSEICTNVLINGSPVGVCTYPSCPIGQVFCAFTQSCVFLTVDPNNCGQCAIQCPSGQCLNSLCTCTANNPDCPLGYDCNTGLGRCVLH